jgi:hypothetical protein
MFSPRYHAVKPKTTILGLTLLLLHLCPVANTSPSLPRIEVISPTATKPDTAIHAIRQAVVVPRPPPEPIRKHEEFALPKTIIPLVRLFPNYSGILRVLLITILQFTFSEKPADDIMDFIVPGFIPTSEFKLQPLSRVLLYLAPSPKWAATRQTLEMYMNTTSIIVAKYKPTLQIYSPETDLRAFSLGRSSKFTVEPRRALWIQLSEYVVARCFL